jgi:hypothetical protein
MKCLWRASLILALAWFSLTTALPARPQEPEKPLPDLQSFLSSVRSKLKTDHRILSQYTYREKQTEKSYDKKGVQTKTETSLFEVFHDRDPDGVYRRLIEKNGRPASEGEIRKQDQKHEKERARQVKKLASTSPKKLAKQKEREDREEREAIGEAFQLYDIAMEAREAVDGRPAIRLSFKPKPGFRVKTDAGKMLSKMTGRAWFDEATQELARIEVETFQDISVGLGVLGKLRKGAKATFRRRYVNDEAWLPAFSQFSGKLRILLVKAMSIEMVNEFSDYRKFTVETSVSYQR